MNYFPNGVEEIELVKFIAKYQYLKISDAQYFFKTNKYYKNRIKRLIDKRILKRLKWNLVLGDFGIEYVKQFDFEYNRLNRNKKYTERLLRISNFAAYFQNCDTVKFTPSFSMKDKECFTTTGRRYIGELMVSDYKYLTYYISDKNDNRYINSVIYDIQKELKYRNCIVLVDDMSRINLEDFACGHHSILIIEDNVVNRERLKGLHSINWYKIICNYCNNPGLAEYNFCDYTDYINKYVSYFYFIDVEKLCRIKLFVRENIGYKTATTICDRSILDILKNEIPEGEHIPITCNDYIEKRRIYE